MPSFAFSPAELAYLHKSLTLTPPIRSDSRTATQFRPLTAETDLLPLTNGSAHLSFSDGSEALVGVKADVDRTAHTEAEDGEIQAGTQTGDPSWVSLAVDLPTLRDDDSNLVFLSEMLRESLVSSSTPSLPDALVINRNWHWKLYIDVKLLSPYALSDPLPLLSLTTHLALLSTRLPKLKSQGEEDPMFDDDWEASTYLYQRARKGKSRTAGSDGRKALSRPPVTLQVMAVGGNAIFDPSREELAVADGIFAISVAESVNESGEASMRMCSIRKIDTPARDTMKGVPLAGEAIEGEPVPGVWQPKIGGVKRSVVKEIVKAVLGGDGQAGVAREVMDGVDGFVRLEAGVS